MSAAELVYWTTGEAGSEADRYNRRGLKKPAAAAIRCHVRNWIKMWFPLLLLGQF